MRRACRRTVLGTPFGVPQGRATLEPVRGRIVGGRSMAESSCTSLANLDDLAAGRLPAAEVEALTQHLESCEYCLARVQMQRPSDMLMSVLSRATILPVSPEQGVVSHLIDRLEKLGQGNRATPFPGGLGEETIAFVPSAV